MFMNEIQKEKHLAEEYKAMYHQGFVTREIAKEQIMPYIDAFNEKSKEIAKKYGMKAKTISFAKFIR